MAPDPLTGEMVVELAMGGWAASTGMRMPPGEGLGSHVIASGKGYYSDDVRNDPHIDPQRVVGDLYAVAGVPLIARDQTIGLLWAARSEPFKPQEVQVLSAIADISASAIHRAALYEQTEQRLQRLAALRDIDLAIASSLDLSIILNILIEQVTAHLGVDAAAVLLLDPYSQTLKCTAWRGFRSHAIAQTQLRLGEGNAGRAALTREIISADLSTGKDSLARAPFLAGEGFAGYYGVPLIVKGQVKGVLEVFHRSGLHRDPEWLEFLETLAGQAAIAIDDAEMFENLQRSNLELSIAYDDTITGWSRALELRDMETEGHSRRVTELTMRLARAMGMSDRELVHVRRGALLHDIGKMGIPDEILRKPGPLDEDEWQSMRQHPVLAYRLLAPISFLGPALEIPYCHHEKWDGTGYPRGLAGEQIPLSARIFALVDVWDALLSARPYREAWPEEKVLAYLQEQAGSHFDPQVVAAFLDLLPELGPSFSAGK
jgi:putative nucleotidyltransferase with HDIG domain